MLSREEKSFLRCINPIFKWIVREEIGNRLIIYSKKPVPKEEAKKYETVVPVNKWHVHNDTWVHSLSLVADKFQDIKPGEAYEISKLLGE